MAKTETVTGLGNTGQIGLVTIAAGVTQFVDEVVTTNTVRGSGQANIDVELGFASITPAIVYNTGGGSGTVSAAGGGDFVNLAGTRWLFQGSYSGNETVNSSAGLATINTGGVGNATNNPNSAPSNVVGLAGAQAVVNSDGEKDLIEAYAGNSTINADNGADVEVDGGYATVHAYGNAVVAFFTGQGGGKLDFINNSTVSATVSGNVPGGSGGSVTAFGGVFGGVYVGGKGGNNSLTGGIGTVTLVAAGTNNILEAAGFSSHYAGQNVLEAGSGSATLTADSTSGYNEFYGGTGTSVIQSFGLGAQTYYVGASGSETITGSRAPGATNEYIFNQDTSGSGNDYIDNFRLGTDHIDINLNGSLSGVDIQSYAAEYAGTVSGSVLYLNDKTKITLYGVSVNALNTSIIGETHI